MGAELAMKYYPLTSIYGCRVFVDMTDTSIGHITQYRPSLLLHTAHAWQNSYPLRFQSMTVFNALTIFNIVARIFKSFLSNKMRNRYHVYSIGSTENCFKDIPADSLPIEYGGTGGTIKELAGNCDELKCNKCNAFSQRYFLLNRFMYKFASANSLRRR